MKRNEQRFVTGMHAIDGLGLARVSRANLGRLGGIGAACRIGVVRGGFILGTGFLIRLG